MKRKTNLTLNEQSLIQSTTPIDIFNQVAQSDADVTEAYSDLPSGRFSAKKSNFSGGIQHIEMTSVPNVYQKNEYKQAIKEMKAKGFRMDDIARKLGISPSYAYQLARE